MTKLLRSVLGLSEADVRPAVALALLNLAVGAAIGAGDVTAQTVFLARAGVEALPRVLLVKAALIPIATLVAARVVLGHSPRRAFVVLALALAGVSVAERFAMTSGAVGASAVYVTHEVVSTVITVHFGVLALEVVAGDTALRSFPLVYAAARGGAALAGLAFGGLAHFAQAADGMFLCAACFALAPLALRGLPAGTTGARTAVATDGSGPPRASAGARTLRWLLVAIGASTAAMVAVRFALRFQQQAILDGIPERELARLLSFYAAGANALAVLLQLLASGRLLARFGLTRVNLAYAVVTTLVQALLFARGGVPVALLARFTDEELKDAVKTPVSTLFYEAFPPELRARARSVVLGVVSPVAQVAVALLLEVLRPHEERGAVLALGAASCVLFLVASLAGNAAYLRAGREASGTLTPA